MGAALFIVLDKEVNFDTSVNGKALARVADALDRLATQLEVKPLMDFYSTDPATLSEEVKSLVVAWTEEWFEAEEGLKTIHALLSHLDNNPTHRLNTSEIVIDLKQFEQVLKAAAVQKAKWHLEVDY